MRKIIWHVLLLCLIALLGGSYWLFASNAGLRWSLNQINQTLGSPLSYVDVTGSLIDEIAWEKLTIKSQDVDLTLNHPRLRLGFAKLVTATLDVEQLSIKRLSIKLRSSTTTDQQVAAEKSVTIPLMIELGRLAIDELSIQQGDSAPLLFTQVQLNDARIKRHIDFEKLSLKSNYGSFSASGKWPLRATDSIRIDSEIETSTNISLPASHSRVALDGPLNNIAIDAKLLSPLAMQLKGELNVHAKLPSWSLQLTANEVALSTLLAGNKTVFKELDLRSEGNLQDFTLKANTSIDNPLTGFWNGELDARQANKSWTILQLRLTDPIQNRSLTGSAAIQTQFEINPNTQGDLQLAWENLAWPLTGESTSRSPSGSLKLSGQLLDYQYQLHTELAFDTQLIHALKVQGSGDSEKLVINNFTGSYLAGDWKGSGSLSLTDGLRWEMAADVAHLDVATFDSRWPSSLSSPVIHTGEFTQGKVAVYTQFNKITGQFTGQQVRGSGELNYTDDFWQLKAINLKSGKTYVKGDYIQTFPTGTIPTKHESHWDVNFTNLALFYPELKGELNSNGIWQMQGDKYRIKAKAHSKHIGFETHTIGTTEFSLNIDSGSDKPGDLTLRAKNLALAGQPIKLKSVSLDALGSLKHHDLNLVLQSDQDDQLRLSAKGETDNSLWQGKITRTTLTTQSLGNWEQRTAASFTVSALSKRVKDFCLSQDKGPATLCANWNADENLQWKLSADYQHLPIELLQAWLPPQLTGISAKFDGKVELQHRTDRSDLQGFVIATASTGTVSKVVLGKKAQSIEFTNLQLQLSNQDTQLKMTAAVDFVDIGYVKLLVAFPKWPHLAMPDVEQRIHGTVDVELKSLAFISLLTDDVHNLIGHWTSHLRLEGKLNAPLVLGTSDISATKVNLPLLGLTLTEVNLSAESQSDRSLRITGSAKSGNGRIKLQGELGDYRNAALAGKLQLTGDSFEAIRVPEAMVVISPKLSLDLQPTGIHVDGEVHIDEALFQIYMPAASITPSSDVVIVNTLEPEAIETPQKTISAKVRIIIGDKVKIQGYGFTGRLKGTLAIDQSTDINTASGELAILDGKYNAYGRELDISEGKLSFTGGLIQNPIVHIKAIKKPNADLVVGINIEGEAKDPKIRLFAEPPLEDADILSYIILGIPIKDAKTKDGNVLASAAASLGLMGGEKLVKFIADKFGIDEVKLESDSTTQAARLVLGKYLSPELYIRYAYGIGQTANVVQLQYKLTDQWMIKTERSSETQQTSTEIQFIKERD